MEFEHEWITATVNEGGALVEVDVVAEAAGVIAETGLAISRSGVDLFIGDLGLVLSPRAVSGIDVLDDGRVHLSTIMRVSHPALPPGGLFEYQHTHGHDLRDALQNGFAQWVQIDLPVLYDLSSATPEFCNVLHIKFPARDGRPERVRRVLLGPIVHHAQWPDPDADAMALTQDEDAHPFCPCCLTTNCFDAFQPLLHTDETQGVRLYAMRGADGEAGADCRVNGHDYEPGMAALRDYARSWPQRGVEFRKQYVIFQNAEAMRSQT